MPKAKKSETPGSSDYRAVAEAVSSMRGITFTQDEHLVLHVTAPEKFELHQFSGVIVIREKGDYEFSELVITYSWGQGSRCDLKMLWVSWDMTNRLLIDDLTDQPAEMLNAQLSRPNWYDEPDELDLRELQEADARESREEQRG
jgi:hypothetical protein